MQSVCTATGRSAPTLRLHRAPPCPAAPPRAAPCTPALRAAPGRTASSNPGARRLPSPPAAAAGVLPPQGPTEPTPDDSAAPSHATAEGFDLKQQWYPLAPLSYLPKDRPVPYTVLGQRLVVWYHKPSQTWRVLEDRCPHRLAPLSEGRIEPSSGNLQCSYHGWQFGADGRCARIPQADSPRQEADACASGRSCAAAFPVREEQGLLWVWMDSGPGAASASRQRPLALPTDLVPVPGAAPAGIMLGDWYMRDLPVGAAALMENLLDPAHVHWAHHGVIGSRSMAGSISLQQEGPLTTQGGFVVRMTGQWGGRGQAPSQQSGEQRPSGGELPPELFFSEARHTEEPAAAPSPSPSGGMPATTHFVPPGLVWLEIPAAGSHFSMLFFAVPVSPGASRMFAGYSTDAIPEPVRSWMGGGRALAPILHALQFLGDLGAHEVVDGDLIHIYQQEQTVIREGIGQRRSYFMPAAADRAALLLYRWLDEMAGGGPQYGSAEGHVKGSVPSSRQLSRREILDRYEQHTRYCPSCRRVLSTVQTARQLLQLAAATGFAAAFTLVLIQALLPQAAPPLGLTPGGRTAATASLPLLVGTAALAAGALQLVLRRLEQRFLFVDYVHADH